MKKNFFILMFILFSASALAQTYYSQMDFALTSPGALKFGLYGYDNPALLTSITHPDIYFTWSDMYGRWNDFNRWGLFTAIPHAGFGVIHSKLGQFSVNDYRISLGFGDRSIGVGLSWGWSRGDIKYYERTNVLTVGTLFRPSRHFSLGLIGYLATSGEGKWGFLDIGYRPLGNEFVTIFGDFAFQKNITLKNLPWSGGLVVEALPGIRLTGRYFDTRTFSVGIQLSLGKIGFSTQGFFDQDRNHSYNTYGIRIGSYDRTMFGTWIIPERQYISLDLNGQVKYQRYKFFDKSSTLLDLINYIKMAKSDKENIEGIAINTSGMIVNREMLWEIREQLKIFKSSGKKVVIFVDRPNIDMYHFASVADKIVMDPQGSLTMEGYILGRTFMKGLLAKLGLGYDEWRFFKYKSVNENLSRDRMSDADREQRKKIIDRYYELSKSEICSGRKISEEKFDGYVNNKFLFLPADALAEGLIDTIARWEAVQDIFTALCNNKVKPASPGILADKKISASNEWGEKPAIAVIYAIGACAMDDGIEARSLSKVIENVVNDKKIKGIVLRVDSPGGDAMASDYVAEAVKKGQGKKPVVVSQGYVAASGGYWISMYADKIVAAPTTITGSIGVIGGWLYNSGMKDTLGFSTDYVKIGKHADIGFGFTIPYLNLSVPDRNMTEDERIIIEKNIKEMYRSFVAKVAIGRKKSVSEIENIAEGRVWSGLDGKENGLVDVLGGLDRAIDLTRELAGIPVTEDIKIIEYPEKGLFDFNMLIPRFLPIQIKDDPVLQHIKLRLENNGMPMPIMPIDEIEIGDAIYPSR